MVMVTVGQGLRTWMVMVTVGQGQARIVMGTVGQGHGTEMVMMTVGQARNGDGDCRTRTGQGW